MTEPGKNAPGLKGFPTPDAADDLEGYLLLYFSDKRWAQFALGALKNLEVGYNWYKSGELDVDEAAEAFRLINQQAPYNKLPSCSLPSGQPLMRINPANGHIQGVDDDGNWADDASLPPPAPRDEPTPDEIRCLGSANTAYALSVLYESLSDSFNAGLSTAEAVTAFVTTVGTALAAEFFPPAAALIAIGGLLFEVVYAVVAFVGADVWDANFTDALVCMLYGCSSVDGDNVVTYDFQCVIDALAAQTNVFDLSFTQLRLFGQLYYILNFIGSQGLDYSSGATAVTSADCTGCGGWCYRFDADHQLGDWEALHWSTEPGLPTYVDGEWHSALSIGGGHTVSYVHIRWVLDTPTTIFDGGILNLHNSCVGGGQGIYVNGDGSIFSGTLAWSPGGSWAFSGTVDSIDILVFCVDAGTPDIWFDALQFSGADGDNPFGDTNC